MSFEIQMEDQRITFDDIIDLSEEQMSIIQSVAPEKTMSEWRLTKSGPKIPLTDMQREVVLQLKDSLVVNKNEQALLKERTIIFTKHANERIAVRVDNGNPKRPPRPESILLIIKLVIESKIVQEMAEWKGHRNLVYTLIHTELGEEFKVSVSFEKLGKQHMRVITVSNEHIDQLSVALLDRPDVQKQLAKMKERLKVEKFQNK